MYVFVYVYIYIHVCMCVCMFRREKIQNDNTFEIFSLRIHLQIENQTWLISSTSVCTFALFCLLCEPKLLQHVEYVDCACCELAVLYLARCKGRRELFASRGSASCCWIRRLKRRTARTHQALARESHWTCQSTILVAILSPLHDELLLHLIDPPHATASVLSETKRFWYLDIVLVPSDGDSKCHRVDTNDLVEKVFWRCCQRFLLESSRTVGSARFVSIQRHQLVIF